MKQLFKIVLLPLVIFGFLICPNITKSQQADSLFKKIENFGDFLLYRNHDTNYISNYGNEIAVRLVAVSKYNYFRIRDKVNNTHVRYRPIRDVSLGMGVSYKWFALDITFSLGLQKKSEFENTRLFDFQGSMFSSKQYISATLQYYQAYELADISGIDVYINDTSKRREDIRTINFGLQYMYAFNYTRFSFKAPFVFNEVQLKSAGSPILGIGFNMFVMDADSSIIPNEAANYFVPEAHMNNLNILSASASLGYMYTFVYKKHFFLSLSIIPGINFNAGDFYDDNRNYIPLNVHLKLNSMNAIGYNGRKIYTGLQFFLDTVFSRLAKKLIAEVGHGKGAIFVGYRFSRKK